MPSAPKPCAIGEMVLAGADYLARHGTPDARVACELIAAHVLRCGRLELFAHNSEIPPAAVVDLWRDSLKRVAAGEPVQYVLGEWDFRRLTLRVDPRALIPRPETEQLVDLVLEAEDLWRQPPLIVDVGTGTGCVALSLAVERPQGRYVAIDVSSAALELAKANAARLNVGNVTFRLTSGCGEFAPGSVDAIVANLPYIPSTVVPTLDPRIRGHEPLQALDGGPDGLDVVRGVARDAVMVLRPGGGLFLEIGDDQGPATRAWLEHLGLVNVAILPDLAGRTRFAVARHGE